MKKTILLLTLFASFANAQYIKEATIKLKKIDEPIKVYDLRYIDKLISFRAEDLPNALATAKVKHIEDLKFDSINYSITIPELKQTYNTENFTYPNGAYETLESFIAKTPSDKIMFPKTHYKALYYEYSNDLVQFFEQGKTDFPIKNYFAVVHNDEVYLNVKAIMNNRADGNGNLSKDIPNNGFLRVKAGTDDFLYVEMPMTKTSTTFLVGVAGGLTAGVASAAGGAIIGGVASGLSNGMIGIASPNLMKGIVLDVEKKEYDIFKNCKDFNTFLEAQSTSAIDCDKDYNISNIRGIMNKI